MIKSAINILAVSDNEYSLQNEHEVTLLYMGRLIVVPAGGTLFFEDAGTYPITVVEDDYYLSNFFAFTIAAAVADDGTPNRVIFNRREELAALKAERLAQIDFGAEGYRYQFITGGAGQVMTYEEKYQEAVAFLADEEIDEDEIPHIMAEIGITGADKASVAGVIVSTRQQWKVLSAQIEALRLGAKKAVGDAATVEAVQALPGVDWSAIGAL